ncbi:cdo1 [Symbiodinium microadriaticum]|nr:cdo1 [Symbiodinium microadriaticum]
MRGSTLSLSRASPAVALRAFSDAPALTRLEKQKKPSDNYLDMHSLVTRLRELFPPAPAMGAPINGDVVTSVTETLQSVKLNPREWQQHAVYRRGRYTRNIVGYSPNQFIVLLLCWERGQQSPIHDHAGAHCFIKMLSGQLQERKFAWAPNGSSGPQAGPPGLLDASDTEKSVSFMHDSLGLHQIENPSESDVAVSLHVYSPPFQECRIFPPTGAPPKTAPMVSVFVPEGLQKAAEESKSLSLQDFCSKLSDLRAEEGDGKTHLHPVLDLLVSAEMTDMEWASYASPMHFSEFQPVQHIIHCDDEFSVVISCWSPGQKIPPHTVGRGRVMWLKVLHGNLLFQEYSPGLFPWESDVERQTELGEGSASFLEECGVRMHDVKNLSETEPAVSIQVFSPPLTSFTFHSEKGTERRDLPWLVGQADATKGSEAFSSSRAVRTAGRWFLSFRGLQSLLNEEFSRPEVTPSVISTLLSKAVFNPQEWRDRLSLTATPGGSSQAGSAWPKHILVAQEKKYSIILSFWGNSPERSVAIEGGTGMSWTLVLEGELEERAVNIGAEGPQVVRSSVLKEESCSFLSREETSGAAGADIIEHSHSSETPCVSLHVYHPPLPEAWMTG